MPAINPSSSLGTALASCESAVATSELTLPGAKGEIRLDRCYRGRDHLVCQLNALMAEAKILLQNYRNIADANYPELRDVTGICAIKRDTLAKDLQNALEFADRFKDLKTEYEFQTNCTTKIERAMTQVTLSDMTQAQSLITSMADAI
jgi:hypothetical protein